MKVVYTGQQPEFSLYFEDEQLSFKAYEPTEVDDANASALLKRGDFDVVALNDETEAPALQLMPEADGGAETEHQDDPPAIAPGTYADEELAAEIHKSARGRGGRR